MIIKGKIKVFTTYDAFGFSDLVLRVKFKVPNKLFYTTRERTIFNASDLYFKDEWEGTKTNLNEECIKILKDKNFLKQQGVDMIENYFRLIKENKTDKNIKDELKELIKKVNNEEIEIEVEIK